jgi:hypothetical protein
MRFPFSSFLLLLFFCLAQLETRGKVTLWMTNEAEKEYKRKCSTAQHSTAQGDVLYMRYQCVPSFGSIEATGPVPPCVPKWSRIFERCRDIVMLHASSNALRSYIIIACNIIQSEKKVGRIATTAGISHRRQRQNKKKKWLGNFILYIRTYSLEFYE